MAEALGEPRGLAPPPRSGMAFPVVRGPPVALRPPSGVPTDSPRREGSGGLRSLAQYAVRVFHSRNAAPLALHTLARLLVVARGCHALAPRWHAQQHPARLASPRLALAPRPLVLTRAACRPPQLLAAVLYAVFGGSAPGSWLWGGGVRWSSASSALRGGASLPAGWGPCSEPCGAGTQTRVVNACGGVEARACVGDGVVGCVLLG